MPKTGFHLSSPLPISDVVEVAQLAEAQGYESFWLSEGRTGGRDAIAQLAFVAAATQRIQLGTGILTVYSRTAPAMAHAAVSMAELSRGRFILGLGAGHQDAIEVFQGVPFTRPASRMRDYVHVIRTALREGRVSYQGRAISVPDLRMARTPDKPVPIYIACLGSALAEMAGEMADGVVPFMAAPTGIQELRQAIARGADRAGRDPSAVEVACFVGAFASDDPVAVEAEARMVIARYGLRPFYQRMLVLSGFGDEIKKFMQAQADGMTARIPSLVSDRMLESLFLMGHPDRWRDTIRRFRAAGVTHPVVNAFPVGPDAKASLLQALRSVANDDVALAVE